MPDIRYEKHIVPDPARPYIYHPRKQFHYFLPHWHENIEILCFHTRSRVVCDRTAYDTSPGDLAIFPSNALHSIPTEAAAEYECLIIDSGFLAENNIDAASLTFDCVVSDKRARELFAAAALEINSKKSFAAAAAKASILALAVHLCRGWSHPAAPGSRYDGSASDAIRRAIGYINSNLSRPMTVDEIAASVSVSKYYFCREFRNETGYTVVRYINDLRCREAERQLRGTSATVGEIARAVGYENLSYFTRTFRSITGKTPSEIRGLTQNEARDTAQGETRGSVQDDPKTTFC